ncbi:MAG: D-alanine aminotransferase [Candidatus Accumulibacter regalis]|jgi:D-alanine transaminase|uniref:D-alanine aminotransferase n=1 Tax=Accumulibacter regalis TaxID=522306 RepID=A0A011QJ72_ACCRE|nr:MULTISPECIES: D-amino acid aminotransferase [unclassified Candidatus Accumulibacter]EXI89060.1 MAG: D-alanine aminotransferase [Candidatus Accumulibacter regalis]MQM34946.1 D-amino acid aminotransferase [Candidatus Accumulibacter phosphatis]MBL8367054.1 D-amino acid aminotransferase [Accumulibacter sp.]MBN8516002.1 D-amino acid aminotransferase [Accumulibacter sp.]MBO3702367.1 D-amino acid aminotransferase [Accumulibacter sp.]
MTAYLNGQFMPLDEARISPLDRGFLFGDGAYEVIPVYARRAFRLEQHLARLQRTLDGIALANPHTLAEWCERLQRVISESEFADQSLYLQVTRGADSKRDQSFPRALPPTVFIFATALPSLAAQRENGVAVLSAVDNRWLRCNLKTVSLLPNVLLRQQAIDAGCAETILLRDGILSEGATSNILMVKDGALLAPLRDHRMLSGVTCDLVLELAAAHGMPCQLRDIADAELRVADELWLTSSTREVLPITRLDGQPVGSGKPGPAVRQMQAWYTAFRQQLAGQGNAGDV